MALLRQTFAQGVLDPTWLPTLAEEAEELLGSANAANTLRAYRADWADFSGWCRVWSLSALPAAPSTVVLYLTDLSSRAKVSTLTRRLSAISRVHQTAGYEPPTRAFAVKDLMAGLRQGSEPAAKRPVRVEDLRAILRQIPDTLLGLRDRALLLLGFTGAFRRSELVGLDVEDLVETRDGFVANISRSKPEREGQARTVGVPSGIDPMTCPVVIVKTWLVAADIRSGAVFRVMNRHSHVLAKRLSGEGVAIVVKRYVEQLGYDPAFFAGHSLRSGLVTSAAAAGKSERAIMSQTGHRSLATIRRYIREGSLFRENAATGIGL
jgi:site-specific recombinase XerD